MDQFFVTLLLASAIVLIAIALLGIGWLVKGKSIIRPGACGFDPTKKKDPKKGCGTETTCELCKKPDDKKNPDQ